MNKIIFITTLIIIFLLNSCAKENLIGINEDVSAKGAIALKINENSIPPQVKQITAELSHLNLDTLRTCINVLNDSLNYITFENVQVGK